MTKHGMSHSPTYATWWSMISRCQYPTMSNYPHYGGRGITVCDRWRNDFRLFLADMGERPAGKTIDRIDGTQGYRPGNCRWATAKEQAANRRPPAQHERCGRGHLMALVGVYLNKRGGRQCARCAKDRAQFRKALGNLQRALSAA